MPRIYNQASISYNYGNNRGNAISNIATTNLQEPFTITKYTLDSTYRYNDEITYIVNIQNNSLCNECPIVLLDNLGSFVENDVTITPLTYVGPSRIFNPENNTFIDIVPKIEPNSICFDIPPLNCNCQKSLVLIYKVKVNEYAPIDVGSQITNTITATACEYSSESSTTVNSEEYADIEIYKYMTPCLVTNCSPITYTFTISNSGNAEATNIEFTDKFTPAPTNISVYVQGTLLSPNDYSYENGLLTIPASYNLSIPPATITRNTTTNEIEVLPSVITIEVVGTL